jgi:hypothetical protein
VLGDGGDESFILRGMKIIPDLKGHLRESFGKRDYHNYVIIKIAEMIIEFKFTLYESFAGPSVESSPLLFNLSKASIVFAK